MRTLRVAAILCLAFLVGAASAEVAVRAKRARDDKDSPSLGNLVSLEVRSDGATIAKSSLMSPAGKPARMVLRDSVDPTNIRMILRVSTAREASGAVCVDYSLRIPELDVVRTGRVSVTPGVEQTLALGPDLTAVWKAVPIPSRAFDNWVRAERARRLPRAS
ncbi:MAG TPA: hypothetical protein VMT17_01180 [Anaeromyxobacteraceae bacterium]|nr:hypothetical protein [Anaeromyxobacteraceae bacterium]